ncbi:MAG: hypothetical protein C4K47_05585 [Candidatus Thorarchaeota archaeon]|nr:MAG: hypothetical protein C4K47_05585 [Candidatus Thorarchaeota archaeon]
MQIVVTPDLVMMCLIGFAVGALIGLERQKRMTEEMSLGVRTFGLHSLLGTISAYIFRVYDNPYILIYAICVSIVFSAASVVYKIFRTTRKGLTTSIVFALSFVLGALVGMDPTPSPSQPLGELEVLAMTISFLVFLVLSFKEELAAAVASVSHEEMIGAAELMVLIAFLWPILTQYPNIAVGPLTFPLFQTYFLVVVLLSIRFASYIIVKKYKDRGPYFFGFFGGFANSEATVSSITDFHNALEEKYPGRMSLAIILANLAMVLRNAVLVVILDPTLNIFRLYLGPLLILLFVGVLRFLYEGRRRLKPEAKEDIGARIKVGFGSPFSLHAALRFAIIFSCVSLLALWAQQSFSQLGMIVAAFIGGFASAGAVVSIAALSYSTGAITLATAAFAVIIATTTSVFNKIIYVFLGDYQGRRDLSRMAARDALVMGAAVLGFLVLLQLGYIPIE